MDDALYKCDSGVVENIKEVATEDSAIAASNDTVLEVDDCLDMVSLSKSCPNDLTGTHDEERLKEANSGVARYKLIPVPK